MTLGTLVFSRIRSQRLPGKALCSVGGMPLLERVLRRARILPWPVFLATTDTPCDDVLVALAAGLGVESYRGSEERVLERAVLAAEAFGLDAFARICGDRPLFPLEGLEVALSTMRDDPSTPDLVTNRIPSDVPPGLTTEVIRTSSLRRILDGNASADDQEHLTNHFYRHPHDFRIAPIPPPVGVSVSPGFAVDTEADLTRLSGIFAVAPDLDLTAADAERISRA